jgi:AraC family transcriptional regulator of arabinose operon
MDVRVIRTMATMTQRLPHRLTVSALAAEVDLSPSRFAHLFRNETGASPIRYLHELRLAYACRLLERTSLTIQTIVVQVGSDPSHFVRKFRRQYGLSPRDWRSAVAKPDGSQQPDHSLPPF